MIIKEIIRLNNNTESEPDDIDHLGNRRVRAVGELLQSRLRIGFQRLRRIATDRMSTLETDIIHSVSSDKFKAIDGDCQEFSTSQLSQFMNQINPLAELEHKRLISSMGPGGLTRERAGFEVRDVHISHYGRICPIQTPEGQNIGLINNFSNFARTNEFGFIETPYAKVKNGKIIGEIIWLDAIEETKYKIAQGTTKIDNNKIIDSVVGIRINGKPDECNKDEVELIDVASNQITSVATSLIPFLESDDANRALMGSNMQRQAVPSIRPSAPLVSTGMEEKAAFDSGRLIISEADGIIKEFDANHIII